MTGGSRPGSITLSSPLRMGSEMKQYKQEAGSMIKGATRLASTLADLMRVLKEEGPRAGKADRRGRPRSANPRGIRLNVQMNKEESRAFRAMCKSMRTKPGTKLRELALAFAGVKA